MPNSKPTYDELLLENEKLRKLVLEKSDADTSGIDSHASVKDESTLKELKLESALEHLAKAVSITDKDGDLINFNTAFAKFHKYKSKEECAKTINGLFDMFEVFLPGGEPLLQEEWPVVRALRGETANNAEYLLKRIDTGEKWTCTYSFAPILDDGGKVTGSVVLCEDISECRQESQRVIKNKNRLEYALNSIETGAWELDLETLGSWRMFKHDQIFGYDKPLQEWTYDMFLEHVIPEDRDEVNQKFQHAIKTKVDWNFECRIKRNNDGQIRWIWANGNQEFNENSESIKMFGIVQDITERKQVELELKKSNELFHIAFNQQFQFMSVLSPDGRILEINELPLQKQGGKREGIIGKFFWELPTWQNSPEWQEIIKGQIKQAASMNETLLTEDVFTTEEGKVHTALASYTAIRDEKNNVSYILVQATDITERKETDERLKESEEKFRAIYDNAPLSYQSLNDDGSFKDINPTWLSTLGYERNEVIGKFYKDFLHPEWQKHFEDNFPKFKKRGYVNDVQFKIRHKDGHYLDIAFEGCIGYYPDGSFKQTYCVFTDITERKIAEEAIYLSNERYKTLFNNSPIPLWEEDFTEVSSYLSELKEKGHKNLDNYFDDNPKELIKFAEMVNILDVNQAALNLHKAINKKQLIENLPETFTKNSFTVFKNELIALFEGKETFKGESEIKTLSGDLKYIHISLKIDKSQPNKVIALIATLDITKQKQAEEKIHVVEKNLKNTFDISPSIISKANMNIGCFIQVNNAITKILGYTVEEFTSKPYMEFVHPDDRQRTIDEATEQLKGREVTFFENRYLCKDGSYKWMAWHGTKPDKNGIATAIGSDIHERKIAEQELAKHREHLEDLVKERTKELETKNIELERFNDLFVDREFRIKELKEKIQRLEND